MIRINSSAPYSLEQHDSGLECTWAITSDPGFRVQLELIDRPLCIITIGEGELEERNIIKTIGLFDTSFPPFISLSGPSTWIQTHMCIDYRYDIQSISDYWSDIQSSSDYWSDIQSSSDYWSDIQSSSDYWSYWYDIQSSTLRIDIRQYTSIGRYSVY